MSNAVSGHRSELSGSRWLDAMLLLGGVAIVLRWLRPAGEVAIFVCAALGLVPLAAVLGNATRDLAARVGPLAAGVLQATMGNASELILGLVALQAGLVEVVKASLTGSIISNLLLVLGLAIFFGGIGRKRQTLDRGVASSNTTTLFLAAVGLIVPAAFSLGVYGTLGGSPGADHPIVESLSLWTAGVLIVIYFASLAYQLCTAKVREPDTQPAPGTRPRSSAHARSWAIMLGAVILIAVLSELLVGQLQAAKLAFHGTDLFWGGVVFALIGNAAEHGVAITAARRDDMDLAMAIGVGSSLQIALLLAPALVFLSLAFHHPMSLVFSGIEVVAVVLSVVMVGMIAADGETNWLEGAQLVAVYLILVIGFYFVPV